MKKIKKRYILAILVLIGVILVAILFNKNKTETFAQHQVTSGTVSQELTLAGTIDARRRVELGFAASGRVKKINFESGDTVSRGQVIAEIDQNNLNAQLQQAEANYTLTRVDTRSQSQFAGENLETTIAEQNAIVEGLYREYISGDLQAYSVDEDDVRVPAPIISGVFQGDESGEYVLDLYSSSSDSGYSFRFSGLENGRNSATTYVASALGELGLYVQFDPDGSYRDTEWIIPVPNTRSSTYALRKRAYESALATRDRIIAGVQSEFNRTLGSDSKSNISRESAQQNQAKAQVSAVVAQLNDGKIRAPFDGIIARNDLELGQIINAYSPVVTLIADTQKELQLNVPEIYINQINEGDEVRIVLDAYPDLLLKGLVDDIDIIDTEVDGVPVYKTKVLLVSDDPRIRLGMNAKANIVAQERTDVIFVPLHYIQTDANNNTSTVQVKINEYQNNTETRIIEIGLIGNDGRAEVVSGLRNGEIVLRDQK